MCMSTGCIQNIVPKNVHESRRICALQTASLMIARPAVMSVIT